MKSGKPSEQPVTRREALAAGGAVALFASAGTGAVTQPAEDRIGRPVSTSSALMLPSSARAWTPSAA